MRTNTGAIGIFGINNADLALNCPVTTDALLGVRPEHIALVEESPLRGEVTMVEPTGADTFVVVKTDAGDVTVRTSPQTQARPGDAVGLEIQPARVSWFYAGSGVRLSRFRVLRRALEHFAARRLFRFCHRAD